MAEVFSSRGMLETQHQPSVAVGVVHPDFERAAETARASYDAGLQALRPGRRFGEVVEAMQAPLKTAGGHNVHPLIHSVNPYGLICGFGEGFAQLPGAKPYGLTGRVPMFDAEFELQAGMTFSFEPSCMFGKRFVNLGGTVAVVKDKPLELNKIATRLMYV
jgi:Xaa-Pro aminopeptidase